MTNTPLSHTTSGGSTMTHRHSNSVTLSTEFHDGNSGLQNG